MDIERHPEDDKKVIVGSEDKSEHLALAWEMLCAGREVSGIRLRRQALTHRQSDYPLEVTLNAVSILSVGRNLQAIEASPGTTFNHASPAIQEVRRVINDYTEAA